MTVFPLNTLPPSVNESKCVARGRLINTSKYTKWIYYTLMELKRFQPYNAEKFSCIISVPYWSYKTRGDIHNYTKAIIDIFVKAKLIKDDKHLIDARTRYVVKTDSGKIEVQFEPLEEEFAAMAAYADEQEKIIENNSK